MASAVLRETYSFLRWRLVPLRALGKLKNQLFGHDAPGFREETVGMSAARLAEIETMGWTNASSPSAPLLREIIEVYTPRADAVVPNDQGHPFENIVQPEDFDARNPVFRLAFSPEILDAANAYFGGAFSMASIQVMRSFPTFGALRESQQWHRDYGDEKSLHFIMYLNDVTEEKHGPFAFLNKPLSQRVKRSPIIRRLSDEQIAAEVGTDEYETFYGRAGDAIWVDPAACYHYGSRCRVPRTAVFITFNTHVPYTEMMEPLGRHRARAAREARKVRPDLAPDYIDRVLQV
ncbi:MAG: hypothetical protein QNI87_07720 [Erythrobacter sp.]|uniref:hypothetical protein n=1 Tax=Erythrobacter sp. TaxID=1042 RepID=UPI002605A778|nr:hypothetical protein [Erythrobacter sp.]MDJ0978409.1 hypothetical protein [Erythrobacter sp.]